MRRRDVVAGLGSVGVLGGAGFIAVRGLPLVDTDTSSPGANDDRSDSDGVEPKTIETLEATGSQAGEVRIPASDRATFVDFFGTWCPPCIDQMPALAKANDRIGESVMFISVTNEAVGRSVSRAEVVEWWETHGGNWLLGIDPTTELTAEYNPTGFPYAVAIDESGVIRWSGGGVKTADEIVAGIETALNPTSDE